MKHLLSSVPTHIIDNIFIDLDGVVADFEHNMIKGEHDADTFKMLPGSYIWLPPIEGALVAISALIRNFPDRIWFLTKPPKHSPYAYTEKALWVQRFFGDEGLHHLIVTQDKSLVGTEKSVIVDDRPHKGNVENFRGEVIHFASPLNVQAATKYGVEPGKCVDWTTTMVIINTLISDRLKASS